MSDARTVLSLPSSKSSATVDRIVRLAIEGLPAMFDTNRKLFCYKLKKTQQGLIQEGISYRYTMMTLLGLHRYEQAGGTSPISVELVSNTLLSDLSWIHDIGDLGVLLWLCAVVAPDRLAKLEMQLPITDALSAYPGAQRGATMELAWFLTGLSYWGLAFPDQRPRLESLAMATFNRLKNNQGELGFFGHLSTSASMMGMVRGRIGSFADQVYPIYAMTQFFRAYRDEEAGKRALDCGLALCRAQGPLGQWWWHYDSAQGKVAEGYPVFSVHQHAMGPMTLFTLGETMQYDFSPWIYKGLQWINFKNELDIDMESASDNLIWRSIARTRFSPGMYWRAALGRRSESIPYGNADRLKVTFECRPYELGWLLYAFGPRLSKPWLVSSGGSEDFEAAAAPSGLQGNHSERNR